MQYTARLAAIPILIVVWSSFGCLGPKAASHTLSQVSGTVVTAEGKPLDRVTMKFTPLDPETGREDVCLVEKGQFKSKILSGKYKVSFEPLQGGTPIPKQFGLQASKLEIDASHDKEVTIELK